MSRLVGRWIRRHRMHIAVGAMVFLLACIPATILIFPDSSIWLALLFIAVGLCQALLQIADLMEDE